MRKAPGRPLLRPTARPWPRWIGIGPPAPPAADKRRAPPRGCDDLGIENAPQVLGLGCEMTSITVTSARCPASTMPVPLSSGGGANAGHGARILRTEGSRAGTSWRSGAPLD